MQRGKNDKLNQDISPRCGRSSVVFTSNLLVPVKRAGLLAVCRGPSVRLSVVFRYVRAPYSGD